MATLKQKHFTWLSLVLLLITYTWFGWYLAGLKARPLWIQSTCYRIFGAPLQIPVGETAPPSEAPSKNAAPPETSKAPAIAPEEKSEPSQEAEPIPPEATSPQTAKPTESDPGQTSTTEEMETPPRQANQSSDVSRTMCGAILRHNLPAGLLAVAWIVVSSMAFISPLTNFSTFISRWFQSDTVAMMTLFMIAGLAAVILYWLHIFLQVLTILAVDILARIDIQYAGLTGVQAFWILTLVSLAGLILGWTANALI